MKFKKGFMTRFIALFLVLVMLVSSGNGFSMQALASEAVGACGAQSGDNFSDTIAPVTAASELPPE